VAVKQLRMRAARIVAVFTAEEQVARQRKLCLRESENCTCCENKQTDPTETQHMYDVRTSYYRCAAVRMPSNVCLVARR